MKTFTLISAIIGILATAFGYWGQYTEAGNKKYDEMAGMIPAFAYYLGIFLLIIASITGAYLLLKSK